MNDPLTGLDWFFISEPAKSQLVVKVILKTPIECMMNI